ncbi:hypothetical protein [Nocardioides flavescens]|uniref:DUF4064 domain-containing protein n=1 Tax=Nocardioides flavescens TaxID=2691959 RepID=A0A6L7F0S4_9ACTN|nr:hypothetical protein [Nocardioides flavescens]MXG89742.1 hypothetical protein [Nocardioides flavescens]
MSDTAPARPPQVTMAGWMILAGSVIVVLMAFGQVSELRSLQTREAVEDYLSTPPGDSLGIGVQGALQAMRVMTMVAAACAAATAILGWQVLQRSKGARIALSVLALPLLVTGLVTGGLVSALVVAASVMLWFQPARDWFAGRAPAPARPAASSPARPDPFAASAPSRDPLLDLPPPSAPPLHPTPYASGQASRVTTEARPASVVWACVLTWIAAGLTATLLVVTMLVVAADPDALFAEVRRQNPDLVEQGMTDGVMRATLFTLGGVIVVWSGVALALGVLTWRRVRWAAIALTVSAACAGVLCLVMLIGSVLMVVPLAACALASSLLLRPEARAWYAAPRP